MTKLIALDGPRNGRYIDAQEAFANGYEEIEWTTGGEKAYLHVETAESVEKDETGVPLEILNEIEKELGR